MNGANTGIFSQGVSALGTRLATNTATGPSRQGMSDMGPRAEAARSRLSRAGIRVLVIDVVPQAPPPSAFHDVLPESVVFGEAR